MGKDQRLLMSRTNICSDGRREGGNFRFPGSSFSCLVILVLCLSVFSSSSCQTQTQGPKANTPPAKTTTALKSPKVTQIDASGLKDLLKPNGRPLLINFWATWCGPCREEFPDLVKIGMDHKGKLDLVTVSLDDLSEINGEVAKFLAEMRSDSPAYLLITPDESAAIRLVSQDWQGGLPFTILFSAQGDPIYSKQGKFEPEILAAEIEKL